MRTLAVTLGLILASPSTPLVASPSADSTLKWNVDTAPRAAVSWPPITLPAHGTPNIVLILLDDVGYAATSTFGGPVQTPELDKLASQGLSFNRFHVSAVCSATRAALLSGRNDHKVGFGVTTAEVRDAPGYDGIWKKTAVSVAEILHRNGYSTASFGKWHNTPMWEVTPVGPFDRWPTGLGFEYFYGFMGSDDSQWEPSLWRNTTPIDPPRTPEQGYHFTTDIVDQAITWVHTHESLASNRPYFIYFAPGATHGPHHAPKEWIARYRGQFDQGWDQLREEIFERQKRLGIIPATTDLTPRPKELPSWDSLSPDEQKLLAREMEVFAGFMAQTDYEIGRLIRAVQEAPGGDNTLIIYIIGDNGADAASGRWGLGGGKTLQDRLRNMDEFGGPLTSYVNYASGWAWATSAPFQWEKDIASHFGGSRDPLVLSWPARIRHGGDVRSQFTHVNDVAATIYDVTGIRFPTVVDGVRQLPLDGVSFAYTFDRPHAPSRHRLQIFEQDGNRSIYQDGWIAAARHTIPWIKATRNDFNDDRWELYHVDTDFSEAHDLAGQYPQKLRALQRLFDVEASKNQIYPLQITTLSPLLNAATDTREFTFYPGLPRISREMRDKPDFSRSHRITAEVMIPPAGAQGVIITEGSRFCGFALYMDADRLIYENHTFEKRPDILTSQMQLPRGQVKLSFDFMRDETKALGSQLSGSGTGRLYVNDQLIGTAHLGPIMECGPLGIGRAFVSPVSHAFQLPFGFTGQLERVEVQLK
jgi:arylsulfatase